MFTPAYLKQSLSTLAAVLIKHLPSFFSSVITSPIKHVSITTLSSMVANRIAARIGPRIGAVVHSQPIAVQRTIAQLAVPHLLYFLTLIPEIRNNICEQFLIHDEPIRTIPKYVRSFPELPDELLKVPYTDTLKTSEIPVFITPNLSPDLLRDCRHNLQQEQVPHH